jgi:hypothetical protein
VRRKYNLKLQRRRRRRRRRRRSRSRRSRRRRRRIHSRETTGIRAERAEAFSRLRSFL